MNGAPPPMKKVIHMENTAASAPGLFPNELIPIVETVYFPNDGPMMTRKNLGDPTFLWVHIWMTKDGHRGAQGPLVIRKA